MHIAKVSIALITLVVFTGGTAFVAGQVQAPPLTPEQQKPISPPAATTADNPLGLTPDHITIWVENVDKEAAWYANVLGFQEVQHRSLPQNEFRQMRIPGVYRIDLTWWKGSTRHVSLKDAPMEQGYRHIVFKSNDLKAALEKLTKVNANVRTQKSQDGSLENLFVLDPENNEIEIQQY